MEYETRTSLPAAADTGCLVENPHECL